MALEKQQVAIQFQGIDTKTDAKLLAENKLTTLQNGVYRNGSINKRYGWASLSVSQFNGTSFTSGSKAIPYNDELLMVQGNTAYAYSEEADRWTSKGDLSPFATSLKYLTSGGAGTGSFSEKVEVGAYAVDENYKVYAYFNSNGYLVAGVIDASTDGVLLADTALSTSLSLGRNAKCLILNSVVYVFYRDVTAIRYKIYNKTTNEFGIEQTLIAGTAAGGAYGWDIIGWSTGMAMSTFNGSEEIVTRVYDSSLSLQGTNTSSAVVGATTQITSLSNNYDSTTGDIYVNFVDPSSSSAGDVKFYSLSSTTFADVITTKTVTSGLSGLTGWKGVVGCANGNDYEIFYSDGSFGCVRKTYNISGNSFSAANIMSRTGGQISKPFLVNSEVMIPIQTSPSATTPASIIVVNRDAEPFALSGQNIALGAFNSYTANVSIVIGSTTSYYFIANILKTERGSITDDIISIGEVKLDLNISEIYSSTYAGDNLYITGGIASLYDGVSVSEHGFLQLPIINSGAAGGAGSIPDGTYNYKAVYEWTDAKGNIHRSAPSEAFEVVTSSGGTTDIDISVGCLNITRKINRVRIILYRTVTGGEVFYRTATGYNSTTSLAITVTDNTTDAALIANELLYTEGGELENFPLPACRYITFANKRLFIGGLEDTTQFAFTKEVLLGEGMQYAEEFTRELSDNSSDNNSPVTGMGTMDGRVFIFKRNSIFGFGGDGPLPTGEQDTFSLPQLIASDTGADSNRGIVVMPLGLMYKSPKGIYLLSRSLDVKYIGADVESYNTATVTGAVMMPDINEVRFTTSASDCLVYNYYYDRWSTFTNYSAVSSTLWQRNFTHLKSNGTVRVEIANRFTDDSSAINMIIETGWIKASGIQNYQRFYRMLLLGQYYSPHTLSLQIGYDYQPYYFETKTLTPFAANTYSISSPLTGSDRYNGTNDGVYQFNVHLSKQKCESVRFKITEVNATTFGQGWAFTDMTLQVGLKKGVFKTMATKQG